MKIRVLNRKIALSSDTVNCAINKCCLYQIMKCWYKENSGGKTHEVGKKERNTWGWCDPARGCLAPNRRRSHPTFGIDDLGFRLAKSF